GPPRAADPPAQRRRGARGALGRGETGGGEPQRRRGLEAADAQQESDFTREQAGTAGEEKHDDILEAPGAEAAPERGLEGSALGRRVTRDAVVHALLDAAHEMRPELGLVVVLECSGLGTSRHGFA